MELKIRRAFIWLIVKLSANENEEGFGDWSLVCWDKIVANMATSGMSGPITLPFEVSQTLGQLEKAQRAIDEHACTLYRYEEEVSFSAICASSDSTTPCPEPEGNGGGRNKRQSVTTAFTRVSPARTQSS